MEGGLLDEEDLIVRHLLDYGPHLLHKGQLLPLKAIPVGEVGSNVSDLELDVVPR